ncbi:MAG: RdgB/HAM1 family non-canonical purine NTP pyrophosphatase [Clostridia bacterium]|nr:RdgB/HAM1 family non-canonical purine NTP pyrophosphatase [Clostridia bacterium]
MKYIIATHNKSKLRELTRILQPLGIEAVTDRDLGIELPEVEETGTTFAENAFLKAQSACLVTGLPAIADDSGIVVDALDGAPGVYSARYGGPGLDDQGRNLLLLKEMDGIPWEKRTAHYTAAVCCVFPDGSAPIAVEGEMHGFVGTEQHGSGGFGYDPLFYVTQADGSLKTAAQLTDDEKDAISHRGNALRLFKQELLTRIG